MPEPKIWRIDVFAGANSSIMAQVYDHAGTPITRANTASVVVSWKPTRSSGATSTSSLTVSSCVFDAWQKDAMWWDYAKNQTIDSTGYNLRWDAPSTAFPTVGEVYAVTITLTETGGQVGIVKAQVTAK